MLIKEIAETVYLLCSNFIYFKKKNFLGVSVVGDRLWSTTFKLSAFLGNTSQPHGYDVIQHYIKLRFVPSRHDDIMCMTRFVRGFLMRGK